jgi:hypothetical protein
VQVIGYANDINIMGRTKRAISEMYCELEERAKDVGLISTLKNQKQRCKAGVPEVEEH